MAEQNRCPHCGANLPPDAPRGVCPRCLMKAGLVKDPDVTVGNPPSIEGPGTKIGRYELLELIGEGGMGLVYLAEQKEPVKRRVAFKIIKPGMDSKQVIARFEAERQALAVLDHPNIAHVFDAGTTEAGRPYFVMEYVKGLSVTRYCDERKLNIEQRLRLFEQVCEAVHHAHQKGIIHRDIKPSNILVSVHGDRAVPKIIDFGIAKAITQPLTGKTFVTYQGQLMGTPQYMSPEQVDLATQDIDTRSDIYSLGVLLYELLAGVLPFDRKSFESAGFAEIQRTIRELEPSTPSTRLTSLGQEARAIAESRRTQVVTLARCLHRELEWIPMKAMRKDRTRRYRSAAELADDVQNYLEGAPLMAGPETTVYRVRKFVRKHAGSVTTVALVAVAITLGLVASVVLGCRAEQARKKEAAARRQVEQALLRAETAERLAQEQRKKAESLAEDYRRALYCNKIALADASYREGNTSRVRSLLESCPADLRGWEWHRLNHIADQAQMTLRGHRELVWSVALSPDGEQIASTSWDGTVRVWDSQKGSEMMTLRGHEWWVNGVAFGPDGECIASGCGDGTVKLWDTASGAELMTFDTGSAVTCVAFSPDGKCLVSGSYGDTVKVWEIATNNQVMALSGHDEGVCSVSFRPDGKYIVSGGYDAVRIWDAATGAEVTSLPGSGQAWFSPDGKRIVSCGAGKTVKVWDTETWAELATLHGHDGRILSVGFSPDGKRIVSGSKDNTIKVWDVATGAELVTLRGHASPVSSVVFTPDGKRVISGGWDQLVKVWDIKISREHMRLRGHDAPVDSVAFTPDGKHIISGSRDNTIKIWDVTTCAEVMTLCGHRYHVTSLSVGPYGKRIASGSLDRTVRVWDSSTYGEVMTLRGHKEGVSSVAFSPDKKSVVSGSWDNTLKLWDLMTGKEIMTLSGHNHEVSSVEFNPAGRQILSGSEDKMVKVWDAATGTELMSLCGDEFRGIRDIAISPDGQRIASAGEQVRVLDAATGAELMVLSGHKHIVDCVAFSPNGKRIGSGCRAGTVTIWDAESGTELMILDADAAIRSIAFSPDGTTLAAGMHDNTIMVWESSPPIRGYLVRQATETAREIVHELYKQDGFYYDVVDKIESDEVITEPVREVALQIVKSRLSEDAENVIRKIRQLNKSPDVDPTAYQALLNRAEKVSHLLPNDWLMLNTLGMLQYRVGSYEEALKTLTRAKKIRADSHPEPDPANVAFIAMTLSQLDRQREAQAALDQLHAFFEDIALGPDRKVPASVIEAEKLLAGKDTELYSVWECIEAGKLKPAAQLLEELRSAADKRTESQIEAATKWLARVFYHRAESRRRRRPPKAVTRPDYAEIIGDYETAARLDPGCAQALNNLAWLRATCPVPEFRDSAGAVTAATKACELTEWKNHDYISTLAAAYSKAGDFSAATKCQKKAIDCLPERERRRLQDNYETRVRLYESGKPYHKGSRWSFSDGRLVGWWKFDEVEGGAVIDSSGNGFDGKLIGGAKTIVDPERGGVLFLGGDGYVDCGSHPSLDITGSITVAAWIKVSAFDRGCQAIITKGDATWRLERSWDDNWLRFCCSGVKTSTSIPWNRTRVAGIAEVDDDSWHHVVGVYDGTRICLYVDGELDASVDAWGNIDTNNSPVCIGENSATLKRGWNGLIDDVRIYSYALSAEEIEMLYKGKEPPREKKSKE